MYICRSWYCACAEFDTWKHFLINLAFEMRNQNLFLLREADTTNHSSHFLAVDESGYLNCTTDYFPHMQSHHRVIACSILKM